MGLPVETALFGRFLRAKLESGARVDEYLLGCTEGHVRSQSVAAQLDSAEIFNTILIELHEHAPQIQHLPSFLYTVSYRRVLDAVRRVTRNRHKPTPDQELMLLIEKAQPQTDPGRTVKGEREFLIQRLQIALERLSPAYRYVILRRYFDGASLAEIASELGALYNTVVIQHRRALARLRKLMAA